MHPFLRDVDAFRPDQRGGLGGVERRQWQCDQPAVAPQVAHDPGDGTVVVELGGTRRRGDENPPSDPRA